MNAVSQGELGSFTNARSLRFERLLPGAVETVWSYLTRPELLARWLAVVDIDLREGGKASFRMVAAEDKPSGVVLRGLVGACDPPRALAYSWDDPRSSNESWVRFELEARGGTTRLVLTQKGIADGALSRSGAAWHVYLGALEARLRGEPPPSFVDVYNALFPTYDDLAEAASRQVRGRATATRDVILQVQSLEAATKFYSEVLGLEIVTRREGLVGFEAGAFRLYVERGKSPGPVFELVVPDLEAAKEKLTARGAEIVDEDPKVPRCYVRDPFGLVFNIAER